MEQFHHLIMCAREQGCGWTVLGGGTLSHASRAQLQAQVESELQLSSVRK